MRKKAILEALVQLRAALDHIIEMVKTVDEPEVTAKDGDTKKPPPGGPPSYP